MTWEASNPDLGRHQSPPGKRAQRVDHYAIPRRRLVPFMVRVRGLPGQKFFFSFFVTVFKALDNCSCLTISFLKVPTSYIFCLSLYNSGMIARPLSYLSICPMHKVERATRRKHTTTRVIKHAIEFVLLRLQMITLDSFVFNCQNLASLLTGMKNSSSQCKIN